MGKKYCGHNCECKSGEDCHGQPALNLIELHDSERSFKEDYGHENGQYVCICFMCKQKFMGHKRRVICKSCSPKCDTCFDKGYYTMGGSFGGAVQTIQCTCQSLMVKKPLNDIDQKFIDEDNEH